MRFPIRLSVMSTVFYLVAAVGCAHEPMPHVGIDLSSPKSAAVSYLRAMSVGDLDSLKTATVGTDADRKPAVAYSAMVVGMRRYDQALVAHFGIDAIRDDVELKQKLMEMVEDRIERTQQGAVNETPEEAMVAPGLNGQALGKRPPIFLRKENGLWKVDLAETAHRDSTLSPESAQRNQAIGDALQRIAREINRGKYKSYEEMQRDADAGMP